MPKNVSPKFFGSIKFGWTKFGLKKSCPSKIGTIQFGKNWVSNSGNIADMEKCHHYWVSVPSFSSLAGLEGARLIRPITGNSLPISWICYRRPLPVSLIPLLWQYQLKSAILELKEGYNEIFTLCLMFRKGIFFIFENYYCGDRVPLDAVMTLFAASSM